MLAVQACALKGCKLGEVVLARVDAHGRPVYPRAHLRKAKPVEQVLAAAHGIEGRKR